MDKLGEVLGWVAAVCYMAAVGNFYVRRAWKRWWTKAPADSPARRAIKEVMGLLGRIHRPVGATAGVAAAVHLCYQVVTVRVSFTGLVAAALLVITATLGALVASGRAKGLVKVHRPIALAVLVAILIHLVAKV